MLITSMEDGAEAFGIRRVLLARTEREDDDG